MSTPVAPRPVAAEAVRRRWTPALVLLAVGAMGASWLLRLPCHQSRWGGELPVHGLCFSDAPTLYVTRGMAEGRFPYLSPDAMLEYPLLQTLIASTIGLLAHSLTATTSVHVAQSIYFDLNAVLLTGVWVAIVLLVARMVPHPRHAALMAVSPAVIATALINWDLWTVLTVVAALHALRRRRWVLGGALLGLGTALKLWPVIVLGALIVRAVRLRDPGPAIRAGAATVLTWTVLNVPFMLLDPVQWGFFWGFSGERGAGFSSVHHVWNVAVGPVLGLPPLGDGAVNLLAYGGFALCCAAILLVGLRARRDPGIEELALLIVGAFVLTNKVYSPQFVLWLIPLVVLVRVRAAEFLGWQAIEVLHWVAISLWLHAVSWRTDALPVAGGLYVLAVCLHVAALLGLCGHVVVDLLRSRPRSDEPDSAPTRPARSAPQEVRTLS